MLVLFILVLMFNGEPKSGMVKMDSLDQCEAFKVQATDASIAYGAKVIKAECLAVDSL